MKTRYLAVIWSVCCAISAVAKEDSHRQEDDMLVNSENMVREIAEIYIKNRYGNDTAFQQKPYQVMEESRVWIINGKPPSALGGSFQLVIAKKDGKVEKITHSK